MRYNAFHIPTAYPDTNSRSPQTLYGNIGSTVRLDCLTPPGKLVDLYYVTWQDAADSATQYFRLLPPHLRTNELSETRLSERYTIDYLNFSLFISDAREEDAGGYQCVVGVADPGNTSVTFLYSQGSTKITLTMFCKPTVKLIIL